MLLRVMLSRPCNPGQPRHCDIPCSITAHMHMHCCSFQLSPVQCRERREVLQAQWSREVSHIQRRAMNKWRFAVAEGRRLQHAGQQIQHRNTARCLWQALSGWRAVARRQQFCRQAISKAVSRCATDLHQMLSVERS